MTSWSIRSSSGFPAAEGPGSVSQAPQLPAGFTDTFTSGYVDAGGIRQRVVAHEINIHTEEVTGSIPVSPIANIFR
ncbi:hypothetical protein [Micromonospora sp. IBHARD004]|uniref:hypothetical protein n=1 Tax=Micromonospora sp. IBHARD004 TaxID=3457764 RepID=UPI0040581F54